MARHVDFSRRIIRQRIMAGRKDLPVVSTSSGVYTRMKCHHLIGLSHSVGLFLSLLTSSTSCEMVGSSGLAMTHPGARDYADGLGTYPVLYQIEPLSI